MGDSGFVFFCKTVNLALKKGTTLRLGRQNRRRQMPLPGSRCEASIPRFGSASRPPTPGFQNRLPKHNFDNLLSSSSSEPAPTRMPFSRNLPDDCKDRCRRRFSAARGTPSCRRCTKTKHGSRGLSWSGFPIWGVAIFYGQPLNLWRR